MPKRNFNIADGEFDLQRSDQIICHQILVGTDGFAEFECRVWKIGEKDQPQFEMGKFEEVAVDDAWSNIKNVTRQRWYGQVEMVWDLRSDHHCSIVPLGQEQLAKRMVCTKVE